MGLKEKWKHWFLKERKDARFRSRSLCPFFRVLTCLYVCDIGSDNMKKIFKECCILFTTAVILAFAGNAISSKGIPLVGQWDTTKGVVSAKGKNSVADYAFEIDTVEKAKGIYDTGEVLFVDARSTEEYKEGHIKGAESLPLMYFDNHIKEFLEKYDPSTFIVTYCSGRECEDSHDLAQFLSEAGYKKISVFIDGYPVWAEQGYPVE